jgi:hypothetical protein
VREFYYDSLAVRNYKTGYSQPESFELYQNYPNPFNSETSIIYRIPRSGIVKLKIYNVLGEEVTTIIDGYKESGNYNVSFDAGDLASGVYIYTMEFEERRISRKMLLLK